jgi:hypothetical protein
MRTPRKKSAAAEDIGGRDKYGVGNAGADFPARFFLSSP